GSDLEGRILGVETQTKRDDDVVVQEQLLTLAAGLGIQRISLDDIKQLDIVDDGVREDLQSALDVLADTLDTGRKNVRFGFRGEGKRKVRVGYLLETPVWKTSYRMVLDGQKAFLQGWAHVENTTDEDWENVAVSLVSGRPISFIQNLYDPIYVQRPEVQMNLYESVVPTEYAADMVMADMEEADSSIGMQSKAMRGVFAGRPMVAAAPAGGGGRINAEAFERGAVSAASGRESGELFEYAIAEPITIARQKSAMLPIVNASVEAEALSIYNEDVDARHPLNGMQLKNSSGLYLMQGPVTVFEDGIYAGDARMPDTQIGEKRLLSYALDLATDVDKERDSDPEEIVSMKIVHGSLILKRKYVDKTTYKVRNKRDEDRTVLVEHPKRRMWDLVSPEKAKEDTGDLYRFRMNLKAEKSSELLVQEQRLADQQVVLSNQRVSTIEIYLKQKAGSAKLQQSLKELVARQRELDRIESRREALERRLKEITQDQERVRQNMKTVARNSETYSRWERKLAEQENEVDAIHTELDALRTEENEKRQALNDYLAGLNVE
ncbi:MAG: DUF4139 domain-containing protein, partial [Verrucomicrobia bacterium]|nr:DUF4139 domain-containing protein [Verrucomicrobiota bacterium]